MTFSLLKRFSILLIFILSSCSYLKPVGEKNRSNSLKNDKSIIVEEIKDSKKNNLDNSNEKISSIEEKKYPKNNKIFIKSLYIETKINGTLVKFDTQGKMPKDNIAVSTQENGNVNITFYKGEFSSAFYSNIEKPPYVKDIHIFEFEENVQLTIVFKKGFSSSEIISNSRKVIISLFN
ncbi:MAG: hypothetical protein CR982_09530 [Candidatus Cloacimonadota bacterium]|nr:MAG: hypothetical protein CR982_09530 [Candidatus Cloacimonadota bacterium]PIE79280.1 MAG: hypothetical protein CSA15_03705 [Candidatus Delongbacteria bacterium]